MKSYIVSHRGLCLLDRQTNRFQRYYFQESVYSPEVYDYLSTLRKSGRTIEAILRAGNYANITKFFTLKEPTPVLVVIMGEHVLDYGWLEDEKGKIVVKYNFNTSICAGGRNSNRVQIHQVTLNPGKYSIRYISDEWYSYNNWGVGESPSFPDNWGIQVFSLAGETKNLQQLLKPG